jgi:hypothetical protein
MEKNPFSGAGLGQFGNESSYFSKGGSGVDPLSYMAGYALDKLTGGSDMGKKMMGSSSSMPGLTQPVQGGMSPYNSTYGLSAPKTGIDPNTFTPIYPAYKPMEIRDYYSNNLGLGAANNVQPNVDNVNPALSIWDTHVQGGQ